MIIELTLALLKILFVSALFTFTLLGIKNVDKLKKQAKKKIKKLFKKVKRLF